LAWKTNAEQSDGYREMGFLKDAFINFLAFLGWNPGTEQEIFSISELIQSFGLDRVSKSGAQFNFEKIKWFNQQYLKDCSDEQLLSLIHASAPAERKGVDEEKGKTLIPMMKERLVLPTDFWEQTNYFFEQPTSYDEKTIRKKWSEESKMRFQELIELLSSGNWDSSEIESSIKSFIEQKGLGFGDILLPLRLMLSGQKGGPSVFDIAAILGKKESLARIQSAFSAFDKIKSGEL